VEDGLRHENLVSHLPDVGRYFDGEMNSAVGFIGDYVYLGGRVNDVLVALVVSPQHVIGNQIPE
jgi:hypothetical protein